MLLFANIMPSYTFALNIDVGIRSGSVIIFFRPANNDSKVVFPHPEGPIIAFSCPGFNIPFEFLIIFFKLLFLFLIEKFKFFHYKVIL